MALPQDVKDAAATYDSIMREIHEKAHQATQLFGLLFDPVIYKGSTEDVKELEELLKEGSYYRFEVCRQIRWRENHPSE